MVVYYSTLQLSLIVALAGPVKVLLHGNGDTGRLPARPVRLRRLQLPDSPEAPPLPSGVHGTGIGRQLGVDADVCSLPQRP